MEKINGLDTIIPIKSVAPKTVSIGFSAMKAIEEAKAIANYKWIAIIPYCIVCKVPLVWVSNSKTLFICPKCGIRWHKANGWVKSVAQHLSPKTPKEGKE